MTSTPTGRAARKFATLVGDVVESRRYPDQSDLLNRLREQLDRVNEQIEATQPLRLTVGDEFQGAYGSLGSALRATLLLRLLFKGIELPHAGSDPALRIGLAWGEITVHDPGEEPFGQSGPGWWLAREAIEEAEALGRRNRLPDSVRTRFAGEGSAQAALVNAFLLSFDQVVFRLDPKDAKIALGTLLGRTQQEIGDELGIGQSTVSKRFRARGPATLLVVNRELEAFTG